MSRRTERLASAIQQELQWIIMRELDDPRLGPLTSVTRVRVSEDLALADVYFTVPGGPGAQSAALHALQHSAGYMRQRLTKCLSIRSVPFLRIHLDEDLKKELELMRTLEDVSRENAELDARRAAEQPGEEADGGELAGKEPSPGEASSADGAGQTHGKAPGEPEPSHRAGQDARLEDAG